LFAEVSAGATQTLLLHRNAAQQSQSSKQKASSPWQQTSPVSQPLSPQVLSLRQQSEASMQASGGKEQIWHVSASRSLQLKAAQQSQLPSQEASSVPQQWSPGSQPLSRQKVSIPQQSQSSLQATPGLPQQTLVASVQKLSEQTMGAQQSFAHTCCTLLHVGPGGGGAATHFPLAHVPILQPVPLGFGLHLPFLHFPSLHVPFLHFVHSLHFGLHLPPAAASSG
jgi:hypothetical protein